MSIPSERDGAKLRPVDVLSVKTGPRYVVTFLGGIGGCDIHWAAGNSFICTSEGACGFSHSKNPPMWRGWAPVLFWDETLQEWYARVLEVTASLEERLRGQQLRGQQWALVRVPHKKKQGAVYGAFIDHTDVAQLPAAFDIRPVLCRLYNVSQIELGKPNPLPPRTLLPYVGAPAPTLPREEAAPEPTKMSSEEYRNLRARAGFPLPHAPSSNGNGLPPSGKGGNHADR